jgi:tetratricopeptide (TPR) repeat protein
MVRKVLVMIAAVLLWTSVLYAGKLVEQEGLNYFNEGVRAQQNGNTDYALASYQKAMIMGLDASKYRAFILNNVGAIYAARGDTDQAESVLLEALKIDPEYKAANFNIAVLYMKQGLCNKAMTYLTRSYNMIGEFVIEPEKVKEPAL